MTGWIAALFFAASMARAQNLPPPDLEFERYAEAVVDAARDSRDARVLMAAASFAADLPWRKAEPSLARRRDALVERAKRLGSDDPVVWWVIGTDYPTAAMPQREHAARRLRELAPNNALGWLMHAGDRDDTAASLARAARSNRFDQYDGEYVRALHAAASAVPPPPAAVARARASRATDPAQQAHLDIALTKWLAHGIPHLRALPEHCGDALVLEGSQLDDCIAIGRLMANRSRSVLAQRLGTRLLLARLPEGAERRAATATRRRLDWMVEKQMSLVTATGWPASIRRWLDPGADELSVLHATLEENGLALEPPPGWRSQFESVPMVTPAGADY